MYIKKDLIYHIDNVGLEKIKKEYMRLYPANKNLPGSCKDHPWVHRESDFFFIKTKRNGFIRYRKRCPYCLLKSVEFEIYKK